MRRKKLWIQKLKTLVLFKQNPTFMLLPLRLIIISLKQPSRDKINGILVKQKLLKSSKFC